MIETEARTKWCPMVRYVPARKFSFGRIKAAVNRWLDDDDAQPNPEPCRCIASDCMAWRREDEYGFQAFVKPDGSVQVASTTGLLEEAQENNWPKFQSVHGHCGLAGKP